MCRKRPSRYETIVTLVDEVLGAEDIAYYQSRHYHSVVALLKDIRSIKEEYYSLGREISQYCIAHNTTREELRHKYLNTPQHKLSYIGYLVYLHRTEQIIIQIMSSSLRRMKKMYGASGRRSYELIKARYFDALPNKVFIRNGRVSGEQANVTYHDAQYTIRTYQRWHKDAISKFGSAFFGFGTIETEQDVHIATEVVKEYMAKIKQFELEQEMA